MLNSHYRESKELNGNIVDNTVPLQLNCIGREEHASVIHADTVRKDWYLFYLYEGVVEVFTPLHTTLHAGDLLIFAPDIPFSYQAAETPTTHYFAHFTGFFADKLLKQCGLHAATVYSPGISATLCRKFNRIFRTFIFKDKFFDPDTATQFSDLLVSAGRRIAAHQNPDAALSRRRLEKSLEYIHKNFAAEISVRELAQLEFLSESHYRALFKTILQQSPLAYITTVRMNTACSLLNDKTVPIHEVARRVGYPDAHYFSRIFKKTYSMSPRDYQKDD